ncbi:MAG: GNAT family N-acetyltransferase [bacterium]
MEFVCYADWESLPDSASALFDQGGKESVFFSRPWFENLTRTAAEDEQSMLLACVIEGSTVLAILPLFQNGTRHWESLVHRYSSLYSVLLATENQAEILNSLARGLDTLPFDSLRVYPVAEHDSHLQGLQEAMEAHGFQCHPYFRFYNWIHRTQGESYQDYLDSRPARVRNTIARKKRKLAREHEYDIRLYTNHNVDRAIADYSAVYNDSWKAHEQYSDVIEGLARSMSEAGWLRLAVLYVDEQPAAAQFWLVAGAKASIFRLAYNEAWKQYSPGSILTDYLMEQVIDRDKVTEIDFLTGNESYKQDWMSERRKRWGVNIARSQPEKGKLAKFVELLKTPFSH